MTVSKAAKPLAAVRFKLVFRYDYVLYLMFIRAPCLAAFTQQYTNKIPPTTANTFEVDERSERDTRLQARML